MKKLLLKSILLLCTLIVGTNSWADETITLTQANLELTSSYSVSAEKTVGGITFVHTDLMKSSDNIQVKASSGVISNKTPFPQNIKSVAITHSGTARATTIYGSANGTDWTQIATGNGSITGNFSSGSYKYFKITRGSNAAYWTQIEIKYESAVADNRTATTVTIDASGITNTNKFTSTTAGSLAATVKADETPVGGASVTWSSETESVATINPSTGAVTLVGEGTTTITASYAGDEDYKPSSNTYELTVTDENPANVTIWSENFSSFSSSAVPTGGTNNYSCTASGTKIYADSNAGGESPELLIAKNGGTFSATIQLRTTDYAYNGDLILKYKTNANPLNVKTTTDGITVDGEANEGDGLTFSTKDTHKVTFKGVTKSTQSITIVFTTTSDNNVRIDDIVLKGAQVALTTVATPTFSPAAGAVEKGSSVTISTTTDGASIYYTTDGTTPSSTSTLYSSALTINNAQTIKAIAIKGSDESNVATAEYTIKKVETPTFSVVAGEVIEGTTVEIETATDGATIHYTTDGATPTSSSPTYSSAITIDADMTIKAIAVKGNWDDSEIASAGYTVIPAIHGLSIDFETDNLSKYVDWEFTDIRKHTKDGMSAHSGSYWGSNVNSSGNGVTIASIKTKEKVKNPGTITFYISKESGNTTSSSWVVEVSSDGSDWSPVPPSEDATSMTAGSWNEVTRELSSYNNVYVRIAYSGSTAIRAIDDIVLTTISEPSTPDVDDVNHTITLTTTANMDGWRAFYDASQDYSLDANTTAYIVTAKTHTENTVELTKLNVTAIPHGEPVILKTTDAGHSMTLTEATGVATLGTNLLAVTDGTNNVDGYRLGYGDIGGSDAVGFFKYTTTTAPAAGIVYIAASNVTTSINANSLSISFDDDETTGVSDVRGKMADGRSDIYNLNGQKVLNPTKGLYIVNGKKVMVK